MCLFQPELSILEDKLNSYLKKFGLVGCGYCQPDLGIFKSELKLTYGKKQHDSLLFGDIMPQNQPLQLDVLEKGISIIAYPPWNGHFF